jgi:20S proteasome alpha/beta subunit
LWLIDATGAYRVRAHAVGGGVGASNVNQQLEEIDFSLLTKEEGVKRILNILKETANDGGGANTRVEIATVSASPSRRMQRLFSSSLFGVAVFKESNK